MGYSDEAAPATPVAPYHLSASGAPVGADPMALIERPAEGVVTLRAPGYRPVTPPPTPGARMRKGSAPRGQRWVVTLVVVVVALALIGAILVGITWR